jgi:Flp pilus assembly protein TadG
MNIRARRRSRRGSVVVVAAISMLMMFGLLALAVDFGYLCAARTQLQRTADAGALAATASLLDGEIATGQVNSATAVSSARTAAGQFAALNTVMNDQPALAQSDIFVGYIANPSNPASQLVAAGAQGYNAVQVRVQRTDAQNGAVSLFFARVLGFDRQGLQAVATAAFLNNVSGFQTPSDGSNLGILPFAMDIQTWQALLAGQGSDNFTYDPTNKDVSHGADGIQETNLYPGNIDAAGNFGTIDIGSASNSSSDICRQILDGISPEDLNAMGGKITVPGQFNGDTGVSATFKQELTAIKGQPRIIPLFSRVDGTGNTAQFTIVGFAGVRIMDVKLTASMNIKHVTIQPANVLSKGTIAGGTTTTSNYVFSPVWLVR